jgi:thermitase
MQARHFLSSCAALLLAFALVLPAGASPAPARAAEVPYVAGELIVGMAGAKPESAGDIALAARQVGAVVTDTAFDRGAYLLSFKTDEAAARAMPALRAAPGVAFVERNGILRIPPVDRVTDRAGSDAQPDAEAFTPNDSLGGYQWHLDKMLYKAAPAPGASAPCIVVIDTGVDYTHPDLAGKVYKGWDFFDRDDDPMDANGHGTHVAGLAAGSTDNTIGISGVSPASNILAVRVLGYDGSGTAWAVAQGIEWANAQHAAGCGGEEPLVYNMSLGGDYSALISSAIASAKNMGRLVVAAAGNSDTSSRSYPGADPNAFGVAATDENDRRAFFSNYDTFADPWVDIAAPGYQLLSTYPAGYETMSGTSMATPVVAGMAARVWAAYPAYSVAQVRYRMQSTGDATEGFPRAIKRVNLYRALGGIGLTLQGRVLDASLGAPLGGAAVSVTSSGTSVCSTLTDAAGFYTCPQLPAAGTYAIRATKAGRLPSSRSLNIGASRFNVDLALTRLLGTSTSGDWTVTLLWNGWQPFETKGLEADIWLVKPGTSPICYSPWTNSQDADAWNLLIPYDSYSRTQTETAWIRKSYGGTLQVWVSLWDGAYNRWPETGRITGSGLQARIYRNNKLVAAPTVPVSPTTATSDNWFIGTINLNMGTWTVANQVKTDAQLPSCALVP